MGVTPQAVPWRRAWALIAAVAVGLTGVIVALRADGFPPVDATVPRATRWFVDRTSGRIVLADGFSGHALARLDTASDGDVLELAQGSNGVAVVDRSAATVRSVDASALRIGPPQSVSLIAEPQAVVGFAQTGLVAVDPAAAAAVLLPPGGDAVPFQVAPGGSGSATLIAPDGAVWTTAAGELTRVTMNNRVTTSGLSNPRFTLVGSVALLLDTDRTRVRFGDGTWTDLPSQVAPSEIVLQRPGPAAGCGWLGADDELWCIGPSGVVESVTVPGLDIDGADTLAIAGDAAALVRRNPAQIVRIDWRTGTIFDDRVASVPPDSQLSVASSVDLIWVDQTDGRLVWAINPWGIRTIMKDDQSSPLLGESGEVLAGGTGGESSTVLGNNDTTAVIDREPDDNGIDDPPVAIDDPVTARTGASVSIAVTANDYDPDGEAVVLFEVGEALHGTVEIASATTAVYRPDAGFVGLDRFVYTIVDGDGTPATARVTLDLLSADATNRAPIGAPDASETGPDVAVVIDVLLNDIDPERDSLRVDSFTPPDVGGTVTETVGPSGLPALRYQPPPASSGTASFTYRPVDALGAVGEPVPVRVEIAQPSDENRPPIVRPDAVRLRRNIPTTLAVLANDRDPDGDRLSLGLVEPLPPGLEVSIEGNELVIIARAGAAALAPFAYTVDDGRGNVVVGSVLVAVIADIEPNRPPIANADTATAVVGTAHLIDVLANDSDPDGDPLILVGVERSSESAGTGALGVQGDLVRYTPSPIGDADGDALDRFTYIISDGNGHEVTGEVSVRVLPERIAAPPFAQDDAATTDVDVPVTLDVLRNDGDPSGERPTLAGTPGCAGGGTAVVTPDSRVRYTPPRGRSGVFSCRYEVTNSQGLRADAAIIISVEEPDVVNAPPVVVDEERTVVVGGTLVVDVLANDSDPDGPRSELRVLSSTTPAAGRATRQGGIITYQAGPVPRPVIITYQVGDAGAGVTSGRLLIRVVEPDPLPPQTIDDRQSIVGPGVPTPIDVLANDSDPDGDPSALRVASASVVSGNGAIEVGSRTITFVPVPSFVGDMVVSYTVVDSDQLTAQGRAILTVFKAPNRAPLAADDVASVISGGRVTVAIALNDFDPDGDPLTMSIVSGPDPALGSARLDGQALVFDAAPGANGRAIIRYRIDDGEATAEATVRIDVLPCAAAPPEAPDLFLQTGYQLPIAIDLRSVARNGDIVEVGAPLSAPSGVYTPPPGENGNITFRYVVRNTCRIQDVGTVVIDVNQDPVGVPYVARIGRTERVSIPVSALASDAEPLRIVGLEGAPTWVSAVDGGRSILVDPAGRTGRVDLVAVIADPGGLQVRVPVSIELVNRAPIANPDEFFASTSVLIVDLLANDTDPDGDLLSLASVPETFTFSSGVVGTIERLGAGQLRLDTKGGGGIASFSYTIVDSAGLSSAAATVTVIANRPPTAPQVEVTVASGSTVNVAIPATDPELDLLTLLILDDPSPLALSISGLVVAITAPLVPPDEIGRRIELRYSVTDPAGASATNLLVITIGAPLPTTTTTSTPSTTTTLPPTSTTLPPTSTTTPSATTTTVPSTNPTTVPPVTTVPPG